MVTIIKSVQFNLVKVADNNNIITMPAMLNDGHIRAHVVNLFNKLQVLGYGEFKQGTQGRGQSHKFIKNSNCPDEFILEVELKSPGRPRKITETTIIQTEVSPIDILQKDDDGVIDDILMEDIQKAIQVLAENPEVTVATIGEAINTTSSDAIVAEENETDMVETNKEEEIDMSTKTTKKEAAGKSKDKGKKEPKKPATKKPAKDKEKKSSSKKPTAEAAS